MKKLLAVTLIGLSALTAAAATSPAHAPVVVLDESLVNARIDARQNELMKALLTARLAGRSAHASR